MATAVETARDPLRKAGVTEDQIDQMLVRNPRAIFEGASRG